MLDDVERVLSQPTKFGGAHGHAPTTMYEGLISTVKAPRDLFDSPNSRSPNRLNDSKMDGISNFMGNEGEDNTGRSHKPNEQSGSARRLRAGNAPEPSEKQFEDPPHTPIIIIMDGKCKVVNP
jgi:hypothetical protein